MKKKIKPTPSSLPSDFSTDENVITKNEVTEQPQTSKEVQRVDDVPLPIPHIDQDASLKIDEAQMMSEDVPETEKTGKSMFVIGSIIGILIVASSIFFSYLYFKTPATPQTSPEPSPTAIVTEAPKTVVPNGDISFEVLNASGVAGQAAKYSKQIEALGFKVVTVGNANSRETGMKLLLKTSLVAQKDLILADLKKEFPTIEYTGEFDSESVTARLIIGE